MQHDCFPKETEDQIKSQLKDGAQQQLAILKAVKARFESSLFDIRQLVQSDLFDSELDAAKELAKHGFARAAGALAGWSSNDTWPRCVTTTKSR
jgi:hypothetical protein